MAVFDSRFLGFLNRLRYSAVCLVSIPLLYLTGCIMSGRAAAGTHRQRQNLPYAELPVAVIDRLAAGQLASVEPVADLLAADLVPVVVLEPLAHACWCFGQVDCLGLVSALLAQLLHVDGVAAFAQQQ